MTRRCSHCSHNGHNSRTCPNRGVRLFGVRLTDGSIRKSASMGNLTQYAAPSSDRHNVNGSGSPADGPDHEDGYASEDFVPGSSSSRERKKGVPWTEEEHRMFLLGLQKLGKGDWRGISRNYVVSRTPTQVASHAQKYFIRQSNVSRRKRRSSLFDIVADESAETNMASDDQLPSNHFMTENESNEALNVPPPLDKEDESMDSNPSNEGETVFVKPVTSEPSYPVIYPAYVAPFYPYPVQYWMGYSTEQSKVETHEVLKPTAVHSKAPINVDELVGMSKLSLGESAAAAAAAAAAGPSSLSLRLPDGSHRQSAFQPGPASGSSRMSSGSSPIHAV